MKKIFMIRFAVLSAAIFTASAFTQPEAKTTKSNLALEWFVYDTDAGEEGQSDPNNYTKAPRPSECNGMNELCAIQAQEDGNTGKPIATGQESVEQPANIALHQ